MTVNEEAFSPDMSTADHRRDVDLLSCSFATAGLSERTSAFDAKAACTVTRQKVVERIVILMVPLPSRSFVFWLHDEGVRAYVSHWRGASDAVLSAE